MKSVTYQKLPIKESRNPKICLPQQSDFHKHVLAHAVLFGFFSFVNLDPRALLFTGGQHETLVTRMQFLFAARIFLGVYDFTLRAVCK